MNVEIGVERGGPVGIEETGDEKNPEEGNGLGGLRQCPRKHPLLCTCLLFLLSVILLAAGVALIAAGIFVVAGAILIGLSVINLVALVSFCCYNRKKERAHVLQEDLYVVSHSDESEEERSAGSHEETGDPNELGE